jgi:hypothetical protein
VFDFQVLAPERLYAIRMARMDKGCHPVARVLSLGQVKRQVPVYEALALHFHRCGLKVFLHNTLEGRDGRDGAFHPAEIAPHAVQKYPPPFR